MRYLLLLFLPLLIACSRPEQGLLQLDGHTMGTTYSVQLLAPPQGVERARLHDAIEQVLKDIVDAMSTYEPDSEISRFNRLAAGSRQPLSPDFAAVMLQARHIHERTGGAFDPTLKPLVNLWGFGAEPRVGPPPAEAEVAEVMAKVGMDKLSLHRQQGTIVLSKSVPGLQLDLSAIAKGYAVDRVAERLQALGIRNLLVEIGGEIRALGRRGERAWRVAIEQPDAAGRVAAHAFELRDQAVATSGDYRNFFQQQGRRYSHVIDPHSGQPVRRQIASATVVAPTAAEADALATACMVMGVEAALALAEREGLAIYLISRGEEGLETHASTAFAALSKSPRP